MENTYPVSGDILAGIEQLQKRFPGYRVRIDQSLIVPGPGEGAGVRVVYSAFATGLTLGRSHAACERGSVAEAVGAVIDKADRRDKGEIELF